MDIDIFVRQLRQLRQFPAYTAGNKRREKESQESQLSHAKNNHYCQFEAGRAIFITANYIETDKTDETDMAKTSGIKS